MVVGGLPQVCDSIGEQHHLHKVVKGVIGMQLAIIAQLPVGVILQPVRDLVLSISLHRKFHFLSILDLTTADYKDSGVKEAHKKFAKIKGRVYASAFFMIKLIQIC
jgi:hypothetical protein